MIYYLCSDRHTYTLGILLVNYPGPLSDRVRILPYSRLGRLTEIPAGTFIFSDFDRLMPSELADVTGFWNYLESFGHAVRMLNDPARVPMRFDLLRRLHDEGVNAFNVYRLSERAHVKRFPVFIRRERGHHSPLTGLLTSREELESAVQKLSPFRYEFDDLMIVEFCNAPLADGLYRKYGAFHIAGRVYAQHCFVRDHWEIRGPRHDAPSAIERENHAYVAGNPHAEILADICGRLRIDYGRIDYGVVDGRIQIFEINTNPTVLDDGPEADVSYDSRVYARMHETEMLRIDLPPSDRVIPIPARIRARGKPLDVNAIHLSSLTFSRRKHARHLRRKKRKTIMSRFLSPSAEQ